MFKQWLKDYFSFTKKERRGIVCLLLIMMLVWFLPDLFPRRSAIPPSSLEALAKEKGELFSDDRDLWDPTEEQQEFYPGMTTAKLSNLVSSAIFQGTLETSDVLPMGGMLIDMNYQRQQKNKDILQSRL